MNHKLLNLLAERVSTGLKRSSIKTCSKWAESYRIMGAPLPGPWTFKSHPWLRQMHDDESEIVAGQKAAQMGYTEFALNSTFYTIDIHAESVLYVLPANQPDANDFSTSRFDPALELSPHLNNLFSNVKNIGHKRAGNANLFVRGSRSKSQLKSVPVAKTILDEVDEMEQKNVPLAFERMSGQITKQAILISTPTISNHGINSYYENSSKNNYCFKCPKCFRHTFLEFPDCLVITADDFTDKKIRESYLICKECKNTLEHETKRSWLATAEWVPAHTNRTISGYGISQLYSCVLKPYEIAISYLKGLINPADEQEFFNSKLGQVHISEGAKVTDDDLEKCKATFIKSQSYSGHNLITMGIDVGKWLHYEICEWFFNNNKLTNDINILATSRLITEGKVLNFEELDQLMQQYRVRYAVIDANPERRKSLEFAQRFYGSVKLCFYGTGISGKAIHVHREEEHTMTVDRTSWLDVSLGRIRNHTIALPRDLSTEYKNHVKAPVRIYEKDSLGNPIGKYIKAENDDDHFAHARTYCELALVLGAAISSNQDISDGIF